MQRLNVNAMSNDNLVNYGKVFVVIRRETPRTDSKYAVVTAQLVAICVELEFRVGAN